MNHAWMGRRAPAKPPVTTRAIVVFEDGAEVEVCCGPAAVHDPRRIVSFQPFGPTTQGRCCHR